MSNPEPLQHSGHPASVNGGRSHDCSDATRRASPPTNTPKRCCPLRLYPRLCPGAFYAVGGGHWLAEQPRLRAGTRTGEIPRNWRPGRVEPQKSDELMSVFSWAPRPRRDRRVQPPEPANLEWLGLGRNRLSGEIPPELCGLSNLERLILGENRLSGEIPPELAGLSKLVELGLGVNQLSGEIPPELGGLSNLRTLFLFGNQMSGGIPPELADLSNLENLLAQQ